MIKTDNKVAKLEEQRKGLVELLGIFVEKERSLAPLAARIFSSLIINGIEGTTFEQLVNDLGASKSTVSTHLNTLLNQKTIIYFTKCGDRKRYYKVTPGYIQRKIEKYITQWEEEIQLQKTIVSFKKHYLKNSEHLNVDLKIHEDIMAFLNASIGNFEKLKTNYKIKENEII